MRKFVCRKCTVPCVIAVISGLELPLRCMVSKWKEPRWREIVGEIEISENDNTKKTEEEK